MAGVRKIVPGSIPDFFLFHSFRKDSRRRGDFSGSIRIGGVDNKPGRVDRLFQTLPPLFIFVVDPECIFYLLDRVCHQQLICIS